MNIVLQRIDEQIVDSESKLQDLSLDGMSIGHLSEEAKEKIR